MSNKPRAKKPTIKKSKGKKKDWSFYVIIVSSIIIAIPLVFLAITAITATSGSGSPVLGNRFENDLDPAIETAQIDTIVSNIQGIDGVDSAFAELKTATLRVYILVPDASEDTLKTVASDAYTKVTETLDPAVYFTIQDVQKQYDLEIHVYNQKEVTEDSQADYVYVLEWKSSNMESPAVQVLSTPISQDIVDYFNQIQAENDAEAEADDNGDDGTNTENPDDNSTESGEGE